MKRFILLITTVLITGLTLDGLTKEHPCLFISQREATAIRDVTGRYPLLDRSIDQAVEKIAAAMARPMDVPPPGEAGGYAHERHKENYREMQTAGLLFTLTGEEKYARFVRDMLLIYADMYPKLGPHPLAHNQAAGKLFHQMLNETVWLVYVSQAYDCIYDWLPEADRSLIEKNIFKPIITWFTQEKAHEFDRIHNHGTWSVASIGMLGFVLDDQNLVDMALYGTKKDGAGGFIRQLDLLFSPDGYYMEGPYYIRYALRPFFLFAEAIERNRPELKIYEYRDQILKKAYYSAVQTTFPDGVFPPVNDASRTMNVEAIGVVIANDLTYYRYGADENLLGVALLQDQVILNGAGLQVARELAAKEDIQVPEWGSIEFTDGHDGKQGGLGILRFGKGRDQSMLLMKYGVHGEGHGHFDKLHFIFYDQQRQVVPDYGFARWVNVEPKFGGRYLPENKSYAKQTVAHNTVTVDQISQNSGNRKEADRVHGLRHFFDSSDPDIQVVSARAIDHYPGVEMQRTMFLINDERLDYPAVVDLYHLRSDQKHEYDYVLHYNGQMITTNVAYTRYDSLQMPMGKGYGYQHIWKTARAEIDGNLRFTWLDGGRYYSLTTAQVSDGKVLFGRIGANDPSFNLRSEPLIILRDTGDDYLFASVIEPHGYFIEAAEKSANARGTIQSIEIIGHSDKGSIIGITGKDNLQWRVMVNNGPAGDTDEHRLEFNDKTYKWTGNYKVDLNAQ